MTSAATLKFCKRSLHNLNNRSWSRVKKYNTFSASFCRVYHERSQTHNFHHQKQKACNINIRLFSGPPDRDEPGQKPEQSTENQSQEKPENQPDEEKKNEEEAEKSGEETVEKTRFQKLTSNLGMLGTGAFVLSKSGKALALLKFTKLGPLFSMGFTTIAYSWVFGYQYAIGMVALLAVHEGGHALAMMKLGIPVGPMVFIPFMGAAVVMKEMPKTAYHEAIVGYAGPLIGTLGTIPLLLYGLTTGSQLAFALANFGFFINLLNLVPFGSFDGGRIAPCISNWMFPFGLASAAYYIWYCCSNPLMYLVFFAGLYETYARFFNTRQLPPGFMNITGQQRILVSLAYFGLIALIIYLMSINDKHRKSYEELSRMQNLVCFGGVSNEGELKTFIPHHGREDILDMEYSYGKILFDDASVTWDNEYLILQKDNPFYHDMQFQMYNDGLGKIKCDGDENFDLELWGGIFAELTGKQVSTVKKTEYDPIDGMFMGFNDNENSLTDLGDTLESVLRDFPNFDSMINSNETWN